MRTVAAIVVLALVAPVVATAQEPKPPLTGTLPTPPPEPPAPPENVIAPPPPPAPAPAPKKKRRAWIGPAVITLEVAAVGFAIASVTVLSVAKQQDTWRYSVAGGLGAGVIACAAAGIIIELVAR